MQLQQSTRIVTLVHISTLSLARCIINWWWSTPKQQQQLQTTTTTKQTKINTFTFWFLDIRAFDAPSSSTTWCWQARLLKTTMIQQVNGFTTPSTTWVYIICIKMHGLWTTNLWLKQNISTTVTTGVPKCDIRKLKTLTKSYLLMGARTGADSATWTGAAGELERPLPPKLPASFQWVEMTQFTQEFPIPMMCRPQNKLGRMGSLLWLVRSKQWTNGSHSLSCGAVKLTWALTSSLKLIVLEL